MKPLLLLLLLTIIPVKNISGTEIEFRIRVEAIVGGVDEDTAVRIANCESRLDPKAKNKNSTASGLYQFTRGTWNNYCQGDVFNPINNLNCFIKLYNKYPYWWVCK